MADSKWYYAKDGQQQEPVDLATIQAMAQTGQIAASDLVWTEGMTDWSQAGNTPAIFPQGSPAQVSTQYPVTVSAEPSARPGAPIPMSYYVLRPMVALYAGFWLRFCAAFIDGIITTVASAILGGVVGVFIGIAIAGSGTSPQEMESIAEAAGNIIGLLIGWLYSALMESSSTQATLGKMAVGIKVTNLNGERISFGRATGRHFGKIISMIPLLFGYFMAGFTERKQALHDIIAGTLVVRK